MADENNTEVNGGQQIPADLTNQHGQQSPEKPTEPTNPTESSEHTTASDATAPSEPTEPSEPKELDKDAWGTTGSDTGDAVLLKLQESGIAPDKAKALLYDAVKAGDPTKIDKDALVKELGEASANIVLTGIDNFIKESTARNNEVVKALHETVGGEDNWNTLRDWAKANLKADEIDEYIELIDRGGLAAKMAAKDLTERYEKAGNTSLKQAEQVVPSANNQQQQTDLKPMSAKEYFAACEKAQRDGSYEAVRGKLLAARNLGKQKGI
jgi:hypothetical protein